ncbi:DNA-binding MurR/RpiR family transcriptional regulator [Rhodoligotrophos appendicifer]|uniref:MurR/RpiR family transcriptional regulator n=1 Tax=Rhodoligotrophos appendicifer TaxID=987056 RepID=UPI0014795C2A|nr:MurR/RpiR family transcriptional regulator [Rhodoligotrophos appendicifer]
MPTDLSTRPKVRPRDEPFGTPTLPRIRRAIDHMPDGQSRIGKYVLDNPEKIIRASLGELALLAQSGEASIVRFCQQLGYGGFREFKIALAAEIATLQSRPESSGGDRRNIEMTATRLADALHETARNLQDRPLRALAKRCKASRRIDIFGAGVSGLVAGFAAYRLMRVGLVAQAFQDATLVHEVMNGLDPSCIALAISETGLSPDTLRFLTRAKAQGAYTVALTGRPKSPLARSADCVLEASPVDPPPIGGETVAAPAKMLVIEALAVAIAKL